METRVAELPNDIIHRIINNPTFTNKHAIQLSLVSKEFLSAVQRRSVLVFEWSNDHDLKLKELEYMISTLTRYKNEGIHLDTFKLSSFCAKHHVLVLMNQCIHLATANNLGRLRNLDIGVPWNKSYVLTPVFRVESLVQLDLNRCCLQQAESMVITWPNLKRLRLKYVELTEEKVFENIIRGCPLIEILEICLSCSIISRFNLKAFNLCYLVKLVIWFFANQTFELGTAAPNLESLALAHASIQRIDLGEHEYHMLKSLSLTRTKDFSGDFLINLAHRFPVLEELHIHQEPGIDGDGRMLNVSSPSLKNIKLENLEGLQEASFDVPNVVHFTFDSDKTHVIPKFSFVGNPRGWTCCITFRICNDSTDTLWFPRLKEYLAAINMSEASLVSMTFKEAATHFKIRARARKPADSNVSFPRITQCLNMTRLDQNKAFSLPFGTEILNGILMTFRPQTLVLHCQDSEFPKVLYDHLMLIRFDNMWIVTNICMRGYQEVVVSREKFLELFKGVDDDRSKILTVSFILRYYRRGASSEFDELESF